MILFKVLTFLLYKRFFDFFFAHLIFTESFKFFFFYLIQIKSFAKYLIFQISIIFDYNINYLVIANIIINIKYIYN